MRKIIATANIVSMALLVLVAVFTNAMEPATLDAFYQLLGLSWIVLFAWSTVLLLRK